MRAVIRWAKRYGTWLSLLLTLFGGLVAGGMAVGQVRAEIRAIQSDASQRAARDMRQELVTQRLEVALAVFEERLTHLASCCTAATLRGTTP